MLGDDEASSNMRNFAVAALYERRFGGHRPPLQIYELFPPFSA